MARIVIVEDDEDIADLLTYKLEDDGHDAIAFTNGEDALAYTGDFDLAILDVMLPGVTGIDVCREYTRRTPRPKIVMLTARGRDEDVKAGHAAGADEYLVKPFSPAHLQERIDALLG